MDALHAESVRGYARKRGDRTRISIVACSTCGAACEVYRSRLLNHKNFFCNKDCHRKLQETLTGAKAARWAGGVTNRGPAAMARKARYRAAHREEIRTKNAAYHVANPGMKTRYRKVNRDKWLPKAIRWSQARRARELGASGTYTDEEWSSLCARFRNICPACGKRCKPTVDHIVPLSKGGTNDISNLQPLCKSCNCRKHAKLIVCYLPWPTRGNDDACESTQRQLLTSNLEECSKTTITSMMVQ